MLPKILPEKLYPEGQDSETTDYVHITYNRAIDDCQSALEKAIKDGVICVVPNENKIYNTLLRTGYNIELGNQFTNYAKAIITLLKEQK